MMPDKSCYDLIKGFEKLRLKPYLDSKGIPTIGYGIIEYPDGRDVQMTDPEITPEQAEELLDYQVNLKSRAVNALHILFNQNQFNAMVCFAYNIGVEGMTGSTAVRLARINVNDPGIRDAMMKWNKETRKQPDGTKKLVVSNGLTKRRKLEADLYFKPVS